MSNIRVRSKERDEDGSKFEVLVCELESESGEDVMEVSAIFEIARAEEGCSQPPVSEDALGNRLGDRGLAGPCEPVQPVDGGHVRIFRPRFDVFQNSVPRPF